jgi:hypothetical protein
VPTVDYHLKETVAILSPILSIFAKNSSLLPVEVAIDVPPR